MTSWIRVAPKKMTDDAVRPFLYKTGSAELADEFNQYFYATLYSQSVKRPLYVYDMANPIGPSSGLGCDFVTRGASSVGTSSGVKALI